MFDRSTIAALAAHAENEYAQAAEETGIVGLATLVGFGILVWASYIHNVRKADKPICSAAYGLAFGLLAIMIHSLSDFGQHLPANALLSGTFCALLLSLAHMGQKSNQITRAVKASRVSAGLRIAALICGSGVWAWVLLGANNARLAEAHWEKAHALEQSLMEEDHAASDEEYLDMISNTAAATDYQPDNVKYRHWLNVYRWQSISGISDPNTGEVFLSEHAIEIVRGIVDELHNSRLLCPTYGATYCVVGQLERSVLGDPTGAERIRKGFRLAPSDPAVCFVAGLLDIEDGHIDVSSAKLNRAVQLNGRFFRGVADIYVNYMDRPDLAVMLAGENTSRLSHIANLLAESDEHQTLAEQARMQVVELLKAKCQEPDAPAEAFASLANIYRMQKNSEAAIEHYRRALVLDYGQVAWRLVLTRLLAETGRIPDAIREARTCLRLSPQFKAAEKFLNDLSVLPGAVAEKNQVP
jgi:tetratricopeptide (TPR) repeat protein